MKIKDQPHSGRFRFLPALAVVAALAGAVAFLVHVDLGRARRVEFVSQTESWSAGAPERDPVSTTGYAQDRRRLVVPNGHDASFRWIIATQQALTDPDWSRHRISYENYPLGRETNDTAPYRWWFTLVARADHVLSSRPLPLAVEHAALYVDPLLQGILLLSLGTLVWRRFGAAAAAAAVLFLAAVFPLAASFAPGAPDPHPLAWVLALWSVLPLVANDRGTDPRRRSMFAGVFGGLALWTDRITAEPVIAGVILGGAAASVVARWSAESGEAPPASWRAWGAAGAVTSLVASVVEFYPTRPGWSVEAVHPLHAVAWLGAGELLHRLSLWSRRDKAARQPRGIAIAAAAILALGSVPLARRLSDDGRFLADDLFAAQLANHARSVRAADFLSWFVRDGASVPLVVTCLPLLIMLGAAGLLVLGKISAHRRAAIALALGPVLVTTALACFQLRWWSVVDVLLGCVVVAVIAAAEGRTSVARPWIWAVVCVATVLPGLPQLSQPKGARGSDPLQADELQAVVARDLAYWLTPQHGAAHPVVFTTPTLSEALAYYGSARILPSLAAENREALAAAGRIASASTWTEASTLLENRQVACLVLPSWDPTLGRLAQMARHLPPTAPVPANSLYANLLRWNLPPWLQPLTYHVPRELGEERLAVSVFALRPAPDEILSACRLADYFVEMGMLDQLPAMREKLRLYPHSLPALAALAQVDLAIGDHEECERTLQQVLPELSRRANRLLPPDRRISLAALLLQSRQRDAARRQTEQSLAAITVADLPALSTGQIVRLIALADVLGLEFPDPRVRATALTRLPPSLRARLEKNRGE